MLAETGVAITPGIDFDPVRGDTMIRFSFAGRTETVLAAMEAISGWSR
jgi:aspartate/methionine/tyrosine aminotransferase